MQSASILAPMLPCCIVHPMPATPTGSLSDQARGPILELAKNATVVAMGPGITTAQEARRLAVALAQEVDAPIVLDADALNAIVDNLYAIDRTGKSVVLTPHPREMARLAGLPTAADVQANRMKTAMVFAQRYDVIVVLKGHKTLVTDGASMFVNPTGNPGMATGGSGDVLTGVIAALIGQGLIAFDAGVLGVYVHGLAGDLAVKEKGQVSLIATDIADFLPNAFLELEKVDYQVALPG
jgi:NAD(P)H-hydrate epimerase